MRSLLALTLLLSACAPVRFLDKPPLWKDPDDLPIARPERHSNGIEWTGLRDAILAPADRALTIDYGQEALNANSLDEVPDSSWWVDLRRTSEVNARPRVLGAKGIERGAFGDDVGPVLPLTVVKGKTVGSTPGLVAHDARGQKYMLKLDPPHWLGLNSSTEVVATRLAWASGWLVPAEKLINVADDQLVLDEHAKTDDKDGNPTKLTAQMLKELLARTPRDADGTLRICASKWLEGQALGSWTYRGRLRDDPNDRIPHEDRRDVRGFGVFASWVNDIDTMENNTMDAYVGKSGRGHLVHYQQDVGGSFGQFAAIPNEVWMGDETFFMPKRILAAILTFGITSRRWEGERREERRRVLMRDYPELGYFDDATFHPRDWHPVLDNPAFVRATRRDRYWGAKRLYAFTPEEVRAAVHLGHYPKDTEDRLFTILWNRRLRILKAFFAEVAAIDYFRPVGDRICFDDLWIDAGLGGDPGYEAHLDHTLVPVVDRCVAVGRVGYHVVTFGVGEPDPKAERPLHHVRVHVMSDERGLRVLGVER